MRVLVRILLGALVVFLALAMAQEWEYFYTSWFAGGETASTLSPTDLEAATETVRVFLSMASHLYSSQGDARFAERIPAAPEVLDELGRDLDYLRRNRRRQEQVLMRLEVDVVQPLSTARVEVRTTEYWVIRIFWSGGDQEAEPPASQVLAVRYLLGREGAGWRVLRWELAERPAPAGEPSVTSSTLQRAP